MRLAGSAGYEGSRRSAAVYLTFECGAQAYDPAITVTDQPEEQIRIDVCFLHGQEAAVLAVCSPPTAPRPDSVGTH